MSSEKLVAFFVLFTSFERGVRECIEFRSDKEGKTVEIDFKKIAKSLDEVFWKDCEQDVSDACDYLTGSDTAPEKYMIISGKPKWQKTGRWQESTLANVLHQIQQVRSNLFHGGKSFDNPSERDIKLAENSVIVLSRIFAVFDHLQVPELFKKMNN